MIEIAGAIGDADPTSAGYAPRKGQFQPRAVGNGYPPALRGLDIPAQEKRRLDLHGGAHPSKSASGDISASWAYRVRKKSESVRTTIRSETRTVSMM